MKRFLKIGGITLAALLLFAALTFAAGYFLSFKQAEIPFPGQATLDTGPFLPGDAVTGKLRFELPLHSRIRSVEVRPGTGAVAAGEPAIRRSAWRFTRMEYRLNFELRPFREGEIPQGSVTVHLTGHDPVTAAIPAFKVDEPQKNDDAAVALAAPADMAKNRAVYLWAALAAAVAAAAAVYWFLRRRRKERPAEPPWARALAGLAQLRTSLAERKMPLETGFVRLTDLVRVYLEERFSIPVSSSTTPEFLHELDAGNSPLPAKERPFLREFLQAADQVKFAKARPDEAILQSAIQSAETLVAETTPLVKEEK